MRDDQERHAHGQGKCSNVRVIFWCFVPFSLFAFNRICCCVFVLALLFAFLFFTFGFMFFLFAILYQVDRCSLLDFFIAFYDVFRPFCFCFLLLTFFIYFQIKDALIVEHRMTPSPPLPCHTGIK